MPFKIFVVTTPTYYNTHLPLTFLATNKQPIFIFNSVAKSINRSQAAALADGFLDDFGAEKGTFQPKVTFTEIILLAGEMVQDMQENLNESNSNASGNLSSSLEIKNPEETGNILRTDITMAYYGLFVNKGVKGTQSGNGLYSFKNNGVSKDMLNSIKNSIKKAGNKITSTNTRKTISSNEKKNKSISDVSRAYGAAVNIKKFGIKATGFVDKAIITTQQKVSQRLGKALKVDIINSLNDI